MNAFQRLVAEARERRARQQDRDYGWQGPPSPTPPTAWPVEFIPNTGVCGCNVKRMGPCAACVNAEQDEQRQAMRGGR